MNGRVDAQGRTLLTLSVEDPATQATATWEAWIDTGFTGELLVPLNLITSLGLVPLGSIGAFLADGSPRTFKRYECVLDWFGTQRKTEVIESGATMTLLGYGLMRDRVLRIDYPARSLTLV